MLRQLLMIFCIASLFTNVSEGATHYVPKDFPTIQKAIDKCKANDTVILSPGKYTGDGNRDIVFRGKRVILRSENPDDPNVVKSTIIDCQGSKDEPHCAFNLLKNGPYSPVIAGITVTGASSKDRTGSCVHAYEGNVIILNCRFIENLGTPIYVFHCNAVIRNCEIRANTGTGIELRHESSAEVSNCIIAENEKCGITINKCSSRITNCRILDNYNIYDGGGIRIESDDVVVKDCLIKNNRTAKSGGGCYARSGYWFIDNCVIDSNVAKKEGGGIWVVGLRTESEGDILNSKVLNNVSEGRGGGISCFKGIISQCQIQNNKSTKNYGGGLANCRIVKNCIISGNKAVDGGGASDVDEIYNCLIMANTSGRFGDIAYCKKVVNCTIINNKSRGEFRNAGSTSYVRNCIIRDNFKTSLKYYKRISYSNVDFDHKDKTNINCDPLFVSKEKADYHLMPGSPCIDAGHPDDKYDNEPGLNGERINIGAYGNTPEAAEKR